MLQINMGLISILYNLFVKNGNVIMMMISECFKKFKDQLNDNRININLFSNKNSFKEMRTWMMMMMMK